MAKEMIVSHSGLQTRLAIVEDGIVSEVAFERDKSRGVVGNLYKGRVNRVLPGMQSAFVDIGLERDAFLYVSDVLEGRRGRLHHGRGREAQRERTGDPQAKPTQSVHRSAPQRGAGGPGPGGQRAPRHQGSPDHHLCEPTRPALGLHADGGPPSGSRERSRPPRSAAACDA